MRGMLRSLMRGTSLRGGVEWEITMRLVERKSLGLERGRGLVRYMVREGRRRRMDRLNLVGESRRESGG